MEIEIGFLNLNEDVQTNYIYTCIILFRTLFNSKNNIYYRYTIRKEGGQLGQRLRLYGWFVIFKTGTDFQKMIFIFS